MGQKCEGNCGLWVLNEMIKKTDPENLKKSFWGQNGHFCNRKVLNPLLNLNMHLSISQCLS